MPQGIYLDNSMAARPSPQAISKMMPFFTEKWGHPSAPHVGGQELYPALKESYKAIYNLLGAQEQDHFVFTSSGAEAINHVILSSFVDVTRTAGKNHFVTSAIDEAPSIMSIGRLELLGCVGKMIQANKQGLIQADAVADAITPRTALVSLEWANGLTGVINPISEISQLCKQRGISLHLDATHILGKLDYDLEKVGAHFITFNGDQLHAPKGTGGLWIKSGIKCSPFILGGIEQAGQRAGSYSIANLVGLGHAAVEALDSRDLLCTEVARLRNKLEEGIRQGFPDACIFFKEEERLPHITAMAFPGVANEALLFMLSRKGVYASIGGGSFQQIGLVLTASGFDETLASSALSFSLSRETTEDQIDRAIDIIVESAKKLHKISNAFRAKEQEI
jgi:cysteine desulfurase